MILNKILLFVFSSFVLVCLNAVAQNNTSELPMAEVLFAPSQQWKTAREEELRFIERIKRFIRKQFKIEKAEHEAAILRSQTTPLKGASEAGLLEEPAEGSINFNPAANQPARFQQRRSSTQAALNPVDPLAVLQGMMSRAVDTFGNAALEQQKNNSPPSFDKAGTFLESLQPPEARAISNKLSNAVRSGRLSFTSLMQVASALADSPESKRLVNKFTTNDARFTGQAIAPADSTAQPDVKESQTITPIIPGEATNLSSGAAPNASDSSKDSFWMNHSSSDNGPIDVNSENFS